MQAIPSGTRRAFFQLALITALGMLNRMDLSLIFFPAFVYMLWGQRKLKDLYAIGLGMLPFIVWECFSLIYYGFLFPNTAYAHMLC